MNKRKHIDGSVNESKNKWNIKKIIEILEKYIILEDVIRVRIRVHSGI